MKHIVGALAVIALGVAGLFWVFGSGGSVRAYLDKTCQYRGMERDDRGYRARAYNCRAQPGVFARNLIGAHKPADRRTSPAGYFLRYQNDMVGVTPQAGGSQVYLADERNGYGYFNNYVGGYWGTYAGPAESFRGGGPGAGK
jgi:hypothetical protein